MKVLGFSAGSTGRLGNVDRIVKTLLDRSGHSAEFVKLTDLEFSGCKGCVKLCADPKACMLDDALLPYYDRIKEADAVVVGSPVYFGSINATTIAFLERFYGYRHVENAIKDKPFILVVAGCGFLENAKQSFLDRLGPFDAKVLDVIEYKSSVFPCFSCGHHKVCEIGGLYNVMGEDAHKLRITPELFHAWEDDAETVAAVDSAAGLLREL